MVRTRLRQQRFSMENEIIVHFRCSYPRLTLIGRTMRQMKTAQDGEIIFDKSSVVTAQFDY
jgi:hypothetical protein